MNQNIPPDVEAYIDGFPKEAQQMLKLLRKLIRKAAPGAEEKISYGMPAYKFCGRTLVYFAGHTNHVGLYATPSAQIKFKKELLPYKTGKGSVQFPLGSSLPEDLITKIVAFRAAENIKKAEMAIAKTKKH